MDNTLDEKVLKSVESAISDVICSKGKTELREIAKAAVRAFEATQAGDSDQQAAINLGAAILSKIEDLTARETAIRNALAMASSDAAAKADNERLREAIVFALEIIQDSWGADQIEAGDDQAANVLRAALAGQEKKGC